MPDCKRYLEAAIFGGFQRIGSSKNGALRLLAYPLISSINAAQQRGQMGTVDTTSNELPSELSAMRYAPKVTVMFRLLHEQSLCFTPRCCASVLRPTIYTDALITC